jgi:NAD(P)-dependent dehydrogenase (short-subunit alcohol dehydrogenase family)
MSAFASYPSLSGRTVFVSGGGSGIGASIVEHFAEQGARVGFVDIDEAASKALVEKIEARRLAVPMFVPCDIRDVAAYQRAIEGVAAKLGTITVLVNNAARDDRHTLAQVTPGLLGRAHRGQPAPRLLRHPDGGSGDEKGGWRLDRELQLGQLPHDDAESLRLPGGQGRGDRHDARPRARPGG